MVGIPGGTFDMGGDDAGGIQSVNVRSFSIGETEVTQKLFSYVYSYSGDGADPQVDITLEAVNLPTFSDFYGEGDDYPAYNVSWFDALVFCNRLSIIEGKTPIYSINESADPGTWGAILTDDWDPEWEYDWNAVTIDLAANGYRLPTEAEWEYAARGGENYLYSGSNNICEVAWYRGNDGVSTDCGATNTSGTKEVKTKAYNAYGLYDMSGNVWEWCFDAFTFYPICGRVENPMRENGFSRVLRGGSFVENAETCRVSLRYHEDLSSRSVEYGFRVALSL
jgi:formylglycine-generating enzyme required for sulfatase activity